MKSVIVLVLVILHLNACGSESLAGDPSGLCTAEQSAVVSAVLRESLDPTNPRMPDYKIASQYDSVYVLDAVGENNCALRDNVLPKFAGASFELIHEDQLDALALEHGGRLVYISLSSIAVERNVARAWIGASINYADKQQGLNLCCCSGEMILEYDDSGWIFDNWAIRVCA